MKLKEQIHIALWLLIPILSLGAALCALQAFHEKTDWAKVPSMSLEQLAQGRQAMNKRMNVNASTDEYFKIMKDFKDLENSAGKLEQVGNNRFVLQSHGADQVILNGTETEFESSWQQYHRNQDMGAYLSAHPEVYKYVHSLPTIPIEPWKVARFWHVLQLLFLLPLPLCISLYVCRIQENGGSVMLEVFNWRFVISCIFWMYGLPYYRNMDFKYQMRRCKAVASYALISSLSCFAAGAQAVAKKLNGEKVVNHPSWSLTGTSAIVNQYVGTNDKVFYGHPVQQSTLTWTASNGLYFGTFGSVPYATKSGQQNYGFEQDISVGWSGGVRHFVFNPDFTYVNLQPLGGMRGDPLQLSLQVARPVKFSRDTVTPYLWINRYEPALGSSPKSGTFYRLGVNNAWQSGKWSATTGAELLDDTGAFSNTPAWLAKASVGISRGVGQHLRLSLPVNFATPITHVSDGRKRELTLGFGINYHFAH